MSSEIGLGALPAQTLREFIKRDLIIGGNPPQVSPASLDLTLSSEAYQINGLLLPQKEETVRELLPRMGAKKVSLGEPLLCQQLYLVKLNESLQLPNDIYGYCNPKSSTGRLDTHVRVLADGVPRFDSVTPAGFTGELWLAIHPKSFSLQVHVGTPLTQLRLFNGDIRFNDERLRNEIEQGLVFDRHTGRCLEYEELVTNEQDGTVVLTALVNNENCGFVCIANPEQVLDTALINHYDASDFFEPIFARDGLLQLEQNKFYILSSAEAVRLSPSVASEMVPIDERSGDFRSHYAGFLDPGWGYGHDGQESGRPFTLEVRPFENMLVRAGQPIAKIRFEEMSAVPDIHYDTKESNYLQQDGPKLGKQFKDI